MFGLVVLVLLALGGWYVWSRLQRLEVEIRQEIEEKSRAAATDPEPVSPPVTAAEPEPFPAAMGTPVSQASPPVDLASELLGQIAAEPGLLQTELYQRLPDRPHKTLQAELLRLSRTGRLRREKSGGSYRLFPG